MLSIPAEPRRFRSRGNQFVNELPDAAGLDPNAVVFAFESDGTDLHAQPNIPSSVTDALLNDAYFHPSVGGIRELK